jgi:hypothetical protein
MAVVRRAVSALALCVIGTLLCASSAGAFVYFTSGNKTIGRANLDASDVRNTFIGTGVDNPTGLAVDGAHIYWANRGTVVVGNQFPPPPVGSIGRANLDGSRAVSNFIPTGPVTEPNGVAVDASYVYWTDQAGFPPEFDPAGVAITSRIGRASLDGSAANGRFMNFTGGGSLTGIAFDGTYVYWIENACNQCSLAGGVHDTNTIGRALLDGSGPDHTFITLPGPAKSLAVDGAHVYWGNTSAVGPSTIGRANLDGTGVDQAFITTRDPGRRDPSFTVSVAVDAQHVYWTNQEIFDGPNATGATIGRAGLDGSGVNQTFGQHGGVAPALAVDALTGPPNAGGLAAPVRGKTAQLRVVKGVVRYRPPGAKSFVKLVGSKTIPVGSVVDTRRGTVALTTAVDAAGTTQTANFSKGQFVLAQSTAAALTTLTLTGGSFAACGTSATVRTASLSAKASAGGKSKRVIRQLRGQGKGKFRTKGRYSAATVRGTTWLTQDRCDGTLVRVIQGTVSVRIKRTGKTVLVSAGNSLLTPAP